MFLRICDFCSKQYKSQHNKTPIGWGHVKCDFRHPGNMGGVIWRFDVCDLCVKNVALLSSKDRALNLAKTLVSSNGTDKI